MNDQEVIPPNRAADGGQTPPAVRTTGQFLDLLEDGGFSAEVYQHMKDLGAVIEEVADASGGKASGELVLKIKLTKEDGAFKVASDFSTKAPKMPRARSILWTDPDTGNFTRFPPGQSQMFGLRDASGAGNLRQD